MTFTPPKYDEVYWRGVAWMDDLARCDSYAPCGDCCRCIRREPCGKCPACEVAALHGVDE